MPIKKRRWWIFLAAITATAVVAILWLRPWRPVFPVALIRVVDAAGRPVSDAVIVPEGMRTKPGPYVSGWYGWKRSSNTVPNPPVKTDLKGEARIPYPKYVFEKIETGTLCLAVSHPDYVSDRPECVVNSLPTAGTPWREWLQFAKNRFANRASLAEAKPITLQKGAILKITVRPETLASRETPLFGQVSGRTPADSNSWIRPEPGTLIARRLAGETQGVRVVQFDASGAAWFSEVKKIVGKSGQTTELQVELTRGATLRGQLDATVPRPIRNGRAVAHVWPPGFESDTYPPQWHSWAPITEDGRFEIPSLPAGNLEVVVLSQGYVSTNGPGRSGLVYPQKHILGTNDLEIIVGMKPTAALEVRVMDDQGKPLPGATVMTAPNVRYGEWSATILATDLYKTSDHLRGQRDLREFKPSADFSGVTDAQGMAIVPNLPIETRSFSIDHPKFAIPATDDGNGGQKHRSVRLKLTPGKTNYASVQLEPREQTPIAHR